LARSGEGGFAMPWAFDGRNWRQAPEQGIKRGNFPVMLSTTTKQALGEGKLVVSGSDSWLKNSSLSYRTEVGNRDLFMHTIYWLTDTENLILGTPRRFRGSIVQLDGGREQSFKYLTVAIIPGLIFLCGALVFFMRRR
jgi:hypothetical protein